MKQDLKILAGVLLAGIVCVAALIGIVESLSLYSAHQIASIVSELGPGTPFSTVGARLGKPVYTLTNPNANEIRHFGIEPPPSIDGDFILYLFPHFGPPYRWVVIYTDKDSKSVRHAEWVGM